MYQEIELTKEKDKGWQMKKKIDKYKVQEKDWPRNKIDQGTTFFKSNEKNDQGKNNLWTRLTNEQN